MVNYNILYVQIKQILIICKQQLKNTNHATQQKIPKVFKEK